MYSYNYFGNNFKNYALSIQKLQKLSNKLTSFKGKVSYFIC